MPIHYRDIAVKYLVADANVVKEGNYVEVYFRDGRLLSKRKCLGQAIMDVLEWLIDKKVESDDKLIKVALGPYKFKVTEQPIIIIDLNRKLSAPYPYPQTGIAIVGSEPMTMIECEDGLPTFLTIRNSTIAIPYMQSNVYLDKLYVRCQYANVVVDLVNVATVWIGDLDIDATNSGMGIRVIHLGAGDHRSWIRSIRVGGADVNVYIHWDFRWVGNITTLDAKKHHAILCGLNTCDFLHVYGEQDGQPPPVVLRGVNYIKHIRRETAYLASDEFFYIDITNIGGVGAGLTCEYFGSDRDWYGAGKSLWKGNLGTRGLLWIKHIVSGTRWLGEVLVRGSGFSGPYRRVEVEGKTILEVTREGIAQMRPFFPIGGTPVTVPAGGSYTYAKFTVPSGKKLVISGIKELYDPDGYISAEVYNETDAETVVSVDGEDWSTYEVHEGKSVIFRLNNSDTAADHVGAYIFMASIVEA